MNQLRPLTLGEILDRMAQTYRRNFLLFAGVAAVPTAAFVIVAGIAGVVIGIFARGGTNSPGFYAAIGLTAAAALLVAVPLCMAAYVFSGAGLTRAAIGAFYGQKFTIREALRSVRPRFWRYLGLMILQGLVFAVPGAVIILAIVAVPIAIRGLGADSAAGPLIGIAAFCIAAAAVAAFIYLGLGYAMSWAVCVAEDKPAWPSMQRAAQLAKGARGRIFVMFLLVWALMFVLSMIAYVPLMVVVTIVTAASSGTAHATALLIGAEIFDVIVNFILQTLITPTYVIALVLFYFDQRVRREGYDIEWMMEQAGLTQAPTPVLEAASSASEQV